MGRSKDNGPLLFKRPRASELVATRTATNATKALTRIFSVDEALKSALDSKECQEFFSGTQWQSYIKTKRVGIHEAHGQYNHFWSDEIYQKVRRRTSFPLRKKNGSLASIVDGINGMPRSGHRVCICTGMGLGFRACKSRPQ